MGELGAPVASFLGKGALSVEHLHTLQVVEVLEEFDLLPLVLGAIRFSEPIDFHLVCHSFQKQPIKWLLGIAWVLHTSYLRWEYSSFLSRFAIS